jgi:hypothetical protein
MGKRHAKASQLQAEADVQRDLSQAEQRRQTAEEERTFLESYLGREDQIAGTGEFADIDPQAHPYTKRYQLDETYAASAIHAAANVRGNYSAYTGPYGGQAARTAAGLETGDMLGMWRYTGQQANDLMQQAEDLARSGDIAGAKALSDQAKSIIGQGGMTVSKGFQLLDDPSSSARQRAGSAQGQVVGSLLRDARGFADERSQVSRDFKRGLTEGAERSIATESRAAQRNIRDVGLSRGVAGGGYGQMAVAARSREHFAAQRAQVHTQASQFFQQYRHEFQGKAVQTAQNWIQNVGGIRDNFQGALDTLDLAAAHYNNEVAERRTEEYGMKYAEAAGGGGFDVGGALSGVMSGASAGAAFGPWGALIGGVAGGAIGGFGGGAQASGQGGGLMAEGGSSLFGFGGGGSTSGDIASKT